MNTHFNFVKDDFVKLKNKKQIQSSVIYKDTSLNVFKVSEVMGNQVKLAYVDNPVPLCEIEPIPINGVDDKSIYYDPVVAASVIAPGQPIPEYRRDYTYYFDSFKRYQVGERTLREIIEEQNCNFVHEVQHFLQEKYHEDDLKIDY